MYDAFWDDNDRVSTKQGMTEKQKCLVLEYWIYLISCQVYLWSYCLCYLLPMYWLYGEVNCWWSGNGSFVMVNWSRRCACTMCIISYSIHRSMTRSNHCINIHNQTYALVWLLLINSSRITRYQSVSKKCHEWRNIILLKNYTLTLWTMRCRHDPGKHCDSSEHVEVSLWLSTLLVNHWAPYNHHQAHHQPRSLMGRDITDP